MEKNDIKGIMDHSENDEQFERMVFAILIGSLVRGNLHEMLKDAPADVCKEFARIWDKLSQIKVGVLFNRPEFELYMITNTKVWTPNKTK